MSTVKTHYVLSTELEKKVNNFVNAESSITFFQTPRVFHFFIKLNNYKPFLVCSYENKEINGLLTGVIIKEAKGAKGYFSARCIVWGGPVVKNNDPALVSAILKELNSKVSSKVIYTEFRNFYSMDKYKQIFEENGFKYEDRLNYIIPISSIEENLKLVSSSKKRQINKGLKADAEIIEAETLQQIKEFYKMLSDLYNTKVKKPLPPFNFFKEFFNDKALGRYLLVNYQAKIVGGVMCPVYKDTIYEWYVCGLDGEYKDIYPSVLATWAPIEYAAKNGLKYFDFMGAGKPDEDYGVREFKSKFGGKLVNYGRFVRINKPVLYKIGKAGLKIMSRLK